MLYATNQYEEAEAAYRQAIELDKNDDLPWNGLGNVLWKKGHFREAEKAYRRSIRLKENSYLPWSGLGDALWKLSRYGESEKAYRQSIALNKEYAIAWNGLGNVLSDTNRYEEAEAAYRQSIALNKESAVAWNGLGNLLYDIKQYEEAEAAYRQSIALNKEYAVAWNGLGSVLRDTNRYEEAEAVYLQAIALDKEYVGAWNGLGNVLYDIKQYKKAEAAYLQAIKLDIKLSILWANYGRLHKKLGLFKSAYSAYQRAYFLGYLGKTTSRKCYQFVGNLLQTFSSPLLVRRILVENTTFYTLPILQLKYRQALEPFRNILQFLELIQKENQYNPQLNTLRVEGLLTHYLGDSFQASEIFDTIDDRSDNDLFDHYYLAVTLEGFFDDNIAVLAEAVEIADDYLQGVQEYDPVQIYYAGQLFLMMEKEEKAAQCFELAIEKGSGFLPLYYGAVLAYHQILETDSLDNKQEYEQKKDRTIIDILKKEQANPEEGYLTYSELGEIDLEADCFAPIFKYAHAMELAPAINIIYDWQEQCGDDHPEHSLLIKVPERHSVNQGDLLKGLVFSEKLEQQIAQLKEIQDEKDIEALKEQLKEVFHGDFLDLKKKDQEELYSYLVSFLEKQNNFDSLSEFYPKVVRYFYLKDQLNEQEVFLLIAYSAYKTFCQNKQSLSKGDLIDSVCNQSISTVPSVALGAVAGPGGVGTVVVSTAFDLVLRFFKNKTNDFGPARKLLSFYEFKSSFEDNVAELEMEIEREMQKAEENVE